MGSVTDQRSDKGDGDRVRAVVEVGGAVTEREAAVRREAFGALRRREPLDRTTLSERTGLPLDEVDKAVASLVAKGHARTDGGGRVAAAAGLSLESTPHRLWLEDVELHTWCAIDAIGIPPALGVAATATTSCPKCGRKIEIEFRAGAARADGELRAWMPADDGCESVVDELCPQMNLFCNEEHLEAWRATAGEPAGTALTVTEVQEMGRQWWGDLR